MNVKNLIAAAAVAAGLVAAGAVAVGAATLDELLQRTHVHGLAVDRGDPERLLVATHHGLYAARLDGTVELVSSRQDDLMGFSAHPTEPDVLYASGHPADGGNLGVIRSDDGGQSWALVSPGVNGPVDFHQMTVSPADPSVIYGIYGDLQTSRDRGESWEIVGSAPQGVIALAASSLTADLLYAGTERGIQISRDGGQSWEPGHMIAAPATALEVTSDGVVYAYMIGQGFLRLEEENFPRWQRLAEELSDDPVLHIAADPADASRLFAATMRGTILRSEDAGASWRTLASR
jgi:photosystem II stability/assembly factor-like uncharacterized protein